MRKGKKVDAQSDRHYESFPVRMRIVFLPSKTQIAKHVLTFKSQRLLLRQFELKAFSSVTFLRELQIVLYSPHSPDASKRSSNIEVGLCMYEQINVTAAWHSA